MKGIVFILTLLALVVSPLMVSQVDAAPVKRHSITAKHNRKLVKKHATRRLAVRKHHRKAA